MKSLFLPSCRPKFECKINLLIAVFGGTAPYIMSAWAKTPNRFVVYVIILLVISALTVLTLPETKGKNPAPP